MEEHVYLCGWQKTGGRFEVWLNEGPFSTAAGASAQEAINNLINAVVDAGGAVTPIFEFNPPLPKTQAEIDFSAPEIFLIAGDERFESDRPRFPAFSSPEVREIENQWYEKFFNGICCKVCRTPQGSRNDQPIVVTHTGRGQDGGFLSLGNSLLKFFSEEFLALLDNEEVKRLQFKPVQRSAGSRKRFFELVGPAGLNTVAVDRLKPSGWRCEACGHREFAYFLKDLAYKQFVAEADLANPLPGLFTVGSPWKVGLCATAERWKAMIGRKGTSGFVSSPLGVVPDRMLVREPDLELLKNVSRSSN